MDNDKELHIIITILLLKINVDHVAHDYLEYDWLYSLSHSIVLTSNAFQPLPIPQNLKLFTPTLDILSECQTWLFSPSSSVLPGRCIGDPPTYPRMRLHTEWFFFSLSALWSGSTHRDTVQRYMWYSPHKNSIKQVAGIGDCLVSATFYSGKLGHNSPHPKSRHRHNSPLTRDRVSCYNVICTLTSYNTCRVNQVCIECQTGNLAYHALEPS